MWLCQKKGDKNNRCCGISNQRYALGMGIQLPAQFKSLLRYEEWLLTGSWDALEAEDERPEAFDNPTTQEFLARLEELR